MANTNSSNNGGGFAGWLRYALYPIARCLQVVGLAKADNDGEEPPPPRQSQAAANAPPRQIGPSVSFEHAPARRVSDPGISPFSAQNQQPSSISGLPSKDKSSSEKAAVPRSTSNAESAPKVHVSEAKLTAPSAPPAVQPGKTLQVAAGGASASTPASVPVPEVDTRGISSGRQPKDSQSLAAVKDKLGKAAEAAAVEIPTPVVVALEQDDKTGSSSGVVKETHSRGSSPPRDRQQKKQKRADAEEGSGQSRSLKAEPLVSAVSGSAKVSAASIKQDKGAQQNSGAVNAIPPTQMAVPASAQAAPSGKATGKANPATGKAAPATKEAPVAVKNDTVAEKKGAVPVEAPAATDEAPAATKGAPPAPTATHAVIDEAAANGASPAPEASLAAAVSEEAAVSKEASIAPKEALGTTKDAAPAAAADPATDKTATLQASRPSKKNKGKKGKKGRGH